MKKHIILLLFLAHGIIISCKKEKPDTTAPSISVSSPYEEQTFLTGSTIEFKASFTDNVALSEYKIDIHSDSDGHSHGKKQSSPWDTLLIDKLSGTTQDLVKSISIPNNAPSGSYDFLVNCIDASGNEAPFKLVKINITSVVDSISPEMTITSPQANETFTKGNSLTINGSLSDQKNNGTAGEISEIEIKLIYSGNNAVIYGQELTVNAATYSLTHTFTIPANAPTGNYKLEITAKDKYNNETDTDIDIVIN